MSHYIQKVFIVFWKLLSYLVCVPNFKSINSNSLSRKKYNGSNFTPNHFYKVIGNYGFICYSRSNLLGTAIKTVLLKTSTNTYFQHYVIHYIAKGQSIGFAI